MLARPALPSTYQKQTAALINTGPPVFISDIEKLFLVAFQPIEFALPEISDPDEDQFQVTVNLQSTIPFASYKSSSKTLTFSPKPSDYNGGNPYII